MILRSLVRIQQAAKLGQNLRLQPFACYDTITFTPSLSSFCLESNAGGGGYFILFYLEHIMLTG